MTTERIQELSNELLAAADLVKELFYNSQPSSELTSSLATLWDACQEYQTTFENFSRQ